MSARTHFVSLPAFALLAMGAATTGALAAAHGELDGIKSATSIYFQDVPRAEADGYVNGVRCVVNGAGRHGRPFGQRGPYSGPGARGQ